MKKTRPAPKRAVSRQPAAAAAAAARRAEVSRETAETRVRVSLNLDGNGECDSQSGIPFLDHMLAQVARHGRLDLSLAAQGDLEVDAHHTMEDCGIALGQALSRALGNKGGVARFGHAYAPLDEALARAVVDLSGRPSLTFAGQVGRPEVGGVDSDLFREFFQALANHAQATLHLDILRGVNAHHQIEALFKAFGLALLQATRRREGDSRPPSTKGAL